MDRMFSGANSCLETHQTRQEGRSQIHGEVDEVGWKGVHHVACLVHCDHLEYKVGDPAKLIPR